MPVARSRLGLRGHWMSLLFRRNQTGWLNPCNAVAMVEESVVLSHLLQDPMHQVALSSPFACKRSVWML